MQRQGRPQPPTHNLETPPSLPAPRPPQNNPAARTAYVTERLRSYGLSLAEVVSANISTAAMLNVNPDDGQYATNPDFCICYVNVSAAGRAVVGLRLAG